jgi:hypothetical protein
MDAVPARRWCLAVFAGHTARPQREQAVINTLTIDDEPA